MLMGVLRIPEKTSTSRLTKLQPPPLPPPPDCTHQDVLDALSLAMATYLINAKLQNGVVVPDESMLRHLKKRVREHCVAIEELCIGDVVGDVANEDDEHVQVLRNGKKRSRLHVS